MCLEKAMTRKRMRFQWFRDIPRNVTHQEYEKLQLREFGMAGLGVLSVILAFVSLTGLTMRTSEELADIEAMSIEEALSYSGDSVELVKLEGFVVAAEPLEMPDDASQKVVRGQVLLAVRGESGASEDEAAEAPREVLFEWEETAETVFLTDGDRNLPLAFDLSALPMQDETPAELSPDLVQEGNSARTNRPVAVEYGDQVFPLAPEVWGESDDVFMDFERHVLPNGQEVVVVARLASTSEGNQLEDPLGDRLQVVLGTEDEIREQGGRMRWIFGVLAIPAAIGSVLFGQSAGRLRREFIERSNQ